MSLLEVKGLTISYKGEKKIYRYPEFYINKGQCLGIMGPVGCGKTTLLNALFGLDFPGELRYEKANILGKDILGTKESLYSMISYMPQFAQSALNPSLTIKNHISHVNKNCQLSHNINYEHLLEEVKLGADVLYKLPYQLSGGMKQRIVLLLALLKNPELLVLDEPSTAIDAITLKIILNLLKEKKRNGLGILIVTHDMGFASHLVDDILKIEEGGSHKGNTEAY